MSSRGKHALAVVALAASFESTRAQDFVAVDWDTSVIYSVDPANASLTPRCTADVVNIIEIQYDPQGVLYAVTAGPAGAAGLYTIDQVTGHATLVAQLTLRPSSSKAAWRSRRPACSISSTETRSHPTGSSPS